MKKVFLILGAVVLLLAAGVAVFIATFDADRFRPLVVQRLESSLGHPVKLGRLSLGWEGGIALRLKELSVSDEASPKGEPMVAVESASALLRLKPLLQKKLEIVSVTVVRPQIRIVTHPDGTLNLQSAVPVEGKAPKAQQAAVAFLISEIAVKDGSVSLSDRTRRPPTEFLLEEITITLKNISLTRPVELKEFSAKTAGGQIRMSGTLRDVTAEPNATLDVALEGLALEQLLPAPGPNTPSLQGRLFASFQGSARGKAWPEISQTLSGQGRLTLNDAVITNLNAVRSILQRLSILPGLMEALEARLPESYRAKLAASDTKILEPVDLSVAVQNGILSFNHFELMTDTFELEGEGRLGLDGRFAAEGRVRLEQTLSEAAISGVNELRYLTNETGEIELPLKVEAAAAHVSILPDMSYVTSRLAGAKASELLERALGKGSQEGGAGLLQDLLGP